MNIEMFEPNDGRKKFKVHKEKSCILANGTGLEVLLPEATGN